MHGRSLKEVKAKKESKSKVEIEGAKYRSRADQAWHDTLRLEG